MSAVEQLTNKLTAIADAIRNKNGLPWEMSIDEMSVAIKQLEIGGGKSAPPDVYNHGGVIGLADYYSHWIYLNQPGENDAQWSVSTNQIFAQYITFWSCFMITTPIFKNGYTKLCFDCEVPDGIAAPYNVVEVGLRYVKNGDFSTADNRLNVVKSLTLYTNQSNYTGTSPWQTMPRTIVEVPLDNVPEDEPFWIGATKCDATCKIYRIWLE